MRARLDFVERSSPHHSPDAADRMHSRLDFVERASPHSHDGADRVHRTDASPYSSASRTRASGVNADHAGERAWPVIPARRGPPPGSRRALHQTCPREKPLWSFAMDDEYPCAAR